MSMLAAYQHIVGKDKIDQLYRLAKLSENKKVVMVNSTKDGGGVAEILHRLVPLLCELGIDCRWETIKAEPSFYEITKSMHNAMQGKKINFSPETLDYYLEVNRKNAKNLNLEADIVVIHDPQPLALVSYYPHNKSKWVWRCHIDTSKPELSLWKFFKKHLLGYEASIYSIAKFSRPLPHPQYLIPPSIDPLAEKNRDMAPEEIKKAVSSFGLSDSKPMLLQVSRFDKFKDPVGVIEAYRLVKKELDIQLVLAGGTASDDPEGEMVLQEVRKAAGNDPDIHILLLDPGSNTQINALQRAADVIIQKSTKEGFGLVVTEAMYKGKPVVGGAVGGITIQIQNHQTGFLVHSPEGAAYRIRYLINRQQVRQQMGKAAAEYVIGNFLITRHLRDYLALFYILYNMNQGIIYV
ncbi:MAG: glycosyltransferase [Actinomycetota bacterium]|nr:glycosyltransferase [Actinomycetota bacterium]